MADGKKETLEIPERIRQEVWERDGGHCRFCGRTDGVIVLHHCLFGGDYVGMGGRRKHDPRAIITVGGAFQHDCHSVIHSRKSLWLPLSLQVIEHPGVTMLQLNRWRRRPRRTSDLHRGVPTIET